ncbi:hypothetical protein Tco_0538282 [Tanacetum coccineum]
MVNWIMQCVTTAAFTLNVNGDKFRYFKGDDLLVICHGDTTSVKVIKKALDAFSACSGLLPNNFKSIVFFGSMKEEDKNDVSFVLPFVTRKLSCEILSGRLQLIVAVLEYIHVYRASFYLLLATIIKEINRLLKCFLWNQSEKANGKAKVAWSSICRPKDQGGLGLKNLQVWNQALLAKHVWNIAIKRIPSGSNGFILLNWLVLAANFYNIWAERNRRIFQDEKRSGDEVFKSIIHVVKSKLFGLAVKDSYAVKKMESKCYDRYSPSLSVNGNYTLLDDAFSSLSNSIMDTTVKDIDFVLKSFLWSSGDSSKGKAKIRDNVKSKITQVLGNGRSTSTWYDKWHPQGPLCEIISNRARYEAGTPDNATVCDMVKDGNWNWPASWTEKFPSLSNVSVPTLKENEHEKAVWINKKGKYKQYSTWLVWRDLSLD